MLKKHIISLLLTCSLPILAKSQQAPVSNHVNNGVNRPALVIGLAIDQMRWDYLYRYYNRYSERGFKRLLSKGFQYQQTMIPYASSSTGPGHATLYTGTVPALHGIVGNNWVDSESGKNMYCTQDTSVQTVGSDSKYGMMSPRNLLTTTIGDELRLATNFNSRVFAVSLKDRGSILPAGQSANAAYWLDDKTGNWISSTWYMTTLPSWVNDINKSRLVDSLMMIDWKPLYDPKTYVQSAADNNQYEKAFKYESTVTFPHVYKTMIGKDYLGIRESPYGNQLTLDFARKLILQEKLGASGQTDMLCVSLSTPDYIGHNYGTQSMEIEDMYLRLDLDIANFLDDLDTYAGAGNYLLFLSADHGVTNTPAFMYNNHITAGQVISSDLAKEMNQYCEKMFGLPKAVNKVMEYQVYLNHKYLDSMKADKGLIKKVLIRYLLTKNEILQAFEYTSLSSMPLPEPIRELFINTYFHKRSGDIQYVIRPYFMYSGVKGAEHGTMYNYDTHIPLIWYGWKIKPGTSYRNVNMTDVAPTIAAMLRIQMPASSIGKVLVEVVE